MRKIATRLTTMASLFLFTLGSSAWAASIYLVPTTNTVDVVAGDIVSFDVMMDFSTDTNGLGSDITLGGGFDIIFDQTALQFDSLVNAGLGDPAFGRDPDVLPGLLESWGFGDFNGLTGPALVGSVSFSVLSTAGSSTSVFTGPTNGIAGPFVSGIDFITILDVDYAGADITIDTDPEPPSVEICTLVTLNPDKVSDFSDADNITGDSCDAFTQTIPTGVVSSVDGTYQIVVTNTGQETLTNVRINAPDFGLVDAPIPAACGDLDPGETCDINFDDAGFSPLSVLDVCAGPGQINRIASVDADGASSGIPVSDDDPAVVNCTAEPDIDLRKQVSLNGGPFVDADSAASGPTGVLGSDAEYRLIVENTGTETLVDVVTTDVTLGLIDVPVPGGPMAPADIRVITAADAGYAALDFLERCDTVGTHLNIAKVDATGELTGAPVSDEDPAYVNCESPMVELLKQVSLDGANFFDADLPGDPDVPVGITGLTDATYRLIVRNTGSETLTDVLLEDATLGISQFISDLAVGETRVLESGDAGFGNLFVPMRCGGTPGNKSNIATVAAIGLVTGTPVGDNDPANVRCIVGAAIDFLKQVSVNGSPFLDADTAAGGPTGLLGDDATYRLIVRNIGDEGLTNITIDDTTLGITSELIPDLPIGAEVVIDAGSFGKFEELFAAGRCDAVGVKLNIAEVHANGDTTGTPVGDDNPAFINCESPIVDSDGDGVLDPDDFCPNTVIPEGVPTKKLKKNRYALFDGDFNFDTGRGGKNRGYTTSDTAGCSCEQIIDAQGLGKGHKKFGCSNGVMKEWIRLVTP